MREGFNTPQGPKIPEGALASETLRVSNELQKKLALLRYRENHSDKEINLDSPEDRNAVMGEWVSSGAAEEFAREHGTDLGKLRQTLRDIDAPNVSDTQH